MTTQPQPRARSLKQTFLGCALLLTALTLLQVALAAMDAVPDWHLAQTTAEVAAVLWVVYAVQKPRA